MAAVAERAFRWIESVAVPEEILYTGRAGVLLGCAEAHAAGLDVSALAAGALLIPPKPGRPAVNFGWCHGPTGTLRLFGLLEQVDSHPRWFSGAQACLGALQAGSPASTRPEPRRPCPGVKSS